MYDDDGVDQMHRLPSFMTNVSQPSTSGLKSPLNSFVAGQFTLPSARAPARALL
jgi:hypothetical protein